MPLKWLFKDKYVGSSPENASVVRTLFDLFSHQGNNAAAENDVDNEKSVEEDFSNIQEMSYPTTPMSDDPH